MPKRQRYEEIADDLTSKIQTGQYPPGSKLPSRTQLCEMYGVSGIVIERVMFMLRAQGLTETLPGVGVFVVEGSADPPA